MKQKLEKHLQIYDCSLQPYQLEHQGKAFVCHDDFLDIQSTYQQTSYHLKANAHGFWMKKTTATLSIVVDTHKGFLSLKDKQLPEDYELFLNITVDHYELLEHTIKLKYHYTDQPQQKFSFLFTLQEK